MSIVAVRRYKQFTIHIIATSGGLLWRAFLDSKPVAESSSFSALKDYLAYLKMQGKV